MGVSILYSLFSRYLVWLQYGRILPMLFYLLILVPLENAINIHGYHEFHNYEVAHVIANGILRYCMLRKTI